MAWPPLDLTDEFGESALPDRSAVQFVFDSDPPPAVLVPRATPADHRRTGVDGIRTALRNAAVALDSARDWAWSINYEIAVSSVITRAREAVDEASALLELTDGG
jgi:hypothetical protein